VTSTSHDYAVKQPEVRRGIKGRRNKIKRVKEECGVSFCVLCLIVVPLSPGKDPFAVQLNNNKTFQVTFQPVAEAVLASLSANRREESPMFLLSLSATEITSDRILQPEIKPG
jgi:hypothetical protein